MPSPPFPSGFAVKSNANSPDREIASVGKPNEIDINTLYKRYEQFVLFDGEKAKFVNELMARVDYLTQETNTLKAEQKRDYEFVSSWQKEKLEYDKWFKSMQRAMSDNPFIMVLIDGDGMIFNNELLREGEAGGRRAACLLFAAIQEYIETELVDVPLGARVACRMYANVRGLSDVLVRTGAIHDTSVFEDFVRGFTRGKTLFDFVDVGSGKDRADEKIIESLKMFSQDFHCRRLLFGCSHDNGYARALEEFTDRPEIVNKVVLLEGVPFEKELVPLPYNTKKFPGLFRETKMVIPGNPYIQAQAASPMERSFSGSKSYNAFAGLPSRFPPPSTRGSSLLDSPLPTAAALAASSLPRTPSSSTLNSDGLSSALKPALNNWAAKAAAPAPVVSESPVYKRTNRDDVIARNRSGQRIDPPCKDYDKTEVDRIKKMKMCNVHYLRQECPYDTGCTHTHAYKPTKDEINTLRLVARLAPCINGSGCQDIKCIYGHRCPAPPSRTNHVKGTKSCIFGENCKYPSELHDIDTNVVKTLVVR